MLDTILNGLTLVTNLKPVAHMNEQNYFRPLLTVFQCLGIFWEPENPTYGKRVLWRIVKLIQLLFLIGMWTWTILMSVNIYYMSLVVTSKSGVDPTNGIRANMIITLVEETPYAFITMRNAIILTTFLTRVEHFKKGL